MGILGVLFLILLTLKLAGIGVVATWSWWIILLPLLVPLFFVLLGVASFVAVMWRKIK